MPIIDHMHAIDVQQHSVPGRVCIDTNEHILTIASFNVKLRIAQNCSNFVPIYYDTNAIYMHNVEYNFDARYAQNAIVRWLHAMSICVHISPPIHIHIVVCNVRVHSQHRVNSRLTLVYIQMIDHMYA